MTELECSNYLKENTDNLLNIFNQTPGNSTEINGQTYLGYEESILSNIDISSLIFSLDNTYDEGDIVSDGLGLYVCIQASTGNAITNTAYFEEKVSTSDTPVLGKDISAFCIIKNGVVVASHNITNIILDNVGAYNYSFDFIEPMTSYKFAIMPGNVYNDTDLTDGGDYIPLFDVYEKLTTRVRFTFDSQTTYYRNFSFYIVTL